MFRGRGLKIEVLVGDCKKVYFCKFKIAAFEGFIIFYELVALALKSPVETSIPRP